jgi:3-dehydroquinate synthase
MAELIKTAVISGDNKFFRQVKNLKPGSGGKPPLDGKLFEAVALAVKTKGRIVEEDPRETGRKRALLNLGHTFGHALEAAAGLGAITHGEAVAWGMARSCELGVKLGITPPETARELCALLDSFGYETRAPHPLGLNTETLLAAMTGDKKKKQGKRAFIVPAKKGAVAVSEGEKDSSWTGTLTPELIRDVINGE